MKNKISIELTFISLILSSCGAHQHTFNDFWSYDDTSHWHDASCEHKDEIIDKANHTFSNWIIDQEPTEFEEGLQHRICDICQYVDESSIDKIEHTHTLTEPHKENEVEPTCTEQGGYDLVAWCTTCDIIISDHIVIEALGHDLVHHGGKEATCLEAGYAEYDTCNRCDYTTYQVIPATGHTPSNAVIENFIDATCTEQGSYESVIYCSVDNVEISRETIIIAPKGHNYQFDSFIWEGYTAKAKCICTRDNSHITYYDATMSSTIKTEATCTTSGIKTYTATYQGHKETKDETIAALGHDYGPPSYTYYDGTMEAIRICRNDINHNEVEVSIGTYEVITPATTTKKGKGRYTFTFTNPAFETQTIDVDIDIIYNGEEPKVDGKFVKYGLYPQTHVTDAYLLENLNKITTPEANGWYLLNNEYYAKTIAEPYYGDASTFNNGDQIIDGDTYWFKCDPITWKILSSFYNVSHMMLSTVILDAQCYYNSYSSRTIDSTTIYSNNYQYSDIREWLNDDFYNSAFSLNDDYVKTTEVINKPYTTGQSPNSYACENTNDKIFLPSYVDYCSSNYGLETADKRKATVTDWAKARGAKYLNEYWGDFWTRSPVSNNAYRAITVTASGTLYNLDNVTKNYGVRPAITFNYII